MGKWGELPQQQLCRTKSYASKHPGSDDKMYKHSLDEYDRHLTSLSFSCGKMDIGIHHSFSSINIIVAVPEGRSF
jgi:hypothetical protein